MTGTQNKQGSFAFQLPHTPMRGQNIFKVLMLEMFLFIPSSKNRKASDLQQCKVPAGGCVAFLKFSLVIIVSNKNLPRFINRQFQRI